MGKQNRQRRAAKQRRRHGGGRKAGSPTDPFGPGGGPFDSSRHQGRDDRMRLDLLLESAYAAGATGDPHGQLDVLVERIDDVAARLGPNAASGRVADELVTAVHQAWHGGWQPADLMGAVRRRNGADTADLLALAILDEHATRDLDSIVPPRWADQLDGVRRHAQRLIGAGCVSARDHLAGAGTGPSTRDACHRSLRAGAVLVGTLRTCPVLPLLGPAPCSWPVERGAGRGRGPGGPAAGGAGRATLDDVDPALLAKVRALLAKAESTTFEAEAMALTAKAQELMTRHAIDRAVLDHDTGDHDEPEGRRVLIDDPYANEKSILLSAVAHPNRCQTVYAKDLGFSTLFGFASDLDAVELLFTSLLVQASAAMIALGSQRDAHGRSRTRSFRQSFLIGFADRIGQRLHQATDDAIEQASAHHGGSVALVPVLEARDERVDEAVHEAFPHTSTRTTRVANVMGYHAGTHAAEQASLAFGDPLPR